MGKVRKMLNQTSTVSAMMTDIRNMSPSKGGFTRSTNGNGLFLTGGSRAEIPIGQDILPKAFVQEQAGAF
jgi:hypothetical protein